MAKLKWANLLEDRCPRCEAGLQLNRGYWECVVSFCGFVIRVGEKERLMKGMRRKDEDARWSPEANQEGLSRLGEGGDNPEGEPGDEVL